MVCGLIIFVMSETLWRFEVDQSRSKHEIPVKPWLVTSDYKHRIDVCVYSSWVVIQTDVLCYSITRTFYSIFRLGKLLAVYNVDLLV